MRLQKKELVRIDEVRCLKNCKDAALDPLDPKGEEDLLCTRSSTSWVIPENPNNLRRIEAGVKLYMACPRAQKLRPTGQKALLY